MKNGNGSPRFAALAAAMALAGCASTSGIAPQSTLRDAASLGLGTARPRAPRM